MCTTIMNALETTMATTQVMPEVSYEVRSPWLPEKKAEYKPLRMNWVVVTGEDGTRQLRMRWDAAKDD
jgi:hypothetical protein